MKTRSSVYHTFNRLRKRGMRKSHLIEGIGQIHQGPEISEAFIAQRENLGLSASTGTTSGLAMAIL